MFKVGDKVRLIERYGAYNEGAEDIVTFVKEPYRGETLIHTKSFVCYSKRLELVSNGFNISTATDQELADEYRRILGVSISCTDELVRRGYDVMYERGGVKYKIAPIGKRFITKTIKETITL